MKRLSLIDNHLKRQPPRHWVYAYYPFTHFLRSALFATSARSSCLVIWFTSVKNNLQPLYYMSRKNVYVFNTIRKWIHFLHYFSDVTIFMILQRGLNSIRVRKKLLTQWMISYGIPAIHHVTAMLHPPINRYGIEQNIPKTIRKSLIIYNRTHNLHSSC